jgi:hypothetical protein
MLAFSVQMVKMSNAEGPPVTQCDGFLRRLRVPGFNVDEKASRRTRASESRANVSTSHYGAILCWAAGEFDGRLASAAMALSVKTRTPIER